MSLREIQTKTHSNENRIISFQHFIDVVTRGIFTISIPLISIPLIAIDSHHSEQQILTIKHILVYQSHAA